MCRTPSVCIPLWCCRCGFRLHPHQIQRCDKKCSISHWFLMRPPLGPAVAPQTRLPPKVEPGSAWHNLHTVTLQLATRRVSIELRKNDPACFRDTLFENGSKQKKFRMGIFSFFSFILIHWQAGDTHHCYVTNGMNEYVYHLHYMWPLSFRRALDSWFL